MDVLRGLTDLRTLNLTDCEALTRVDGLRGLTGLRTLKLSRCKALTKVDEPSNSTSIAGDVAR